MFMHLMSNILKTALYFILVDLLISFFYFKSVICKLPVKIWVVTWRRSVNIIEVLINEYGFAYLSAYTWQQPIIKMLLLKVICLVPNRLIRIYQFDAERTTCLWYNTPLTNWSLNVLDSDHTHSARSWRNDWCRLAFSLKEALIWYWYTENIYWYTDILIFSIYKWRN